MQHLIAIIHQSQKILTTVRYRAVAGTRPYYIKLNTHQRFFSRESRDDSRLQEHLKTSRDTYTIPVFALHSLVQTLCATLCVFSRVPTALVHKHNWALRCAWLSHHANWLPRIAFSGQTGTHPGRRHDTGSAAGAGDTFCIEAERGESRYVDLDWLKKCMCNYFILIYYTEIKWNRLNRYGQ